MSPVANSPEVGGWQCITPYLLREIEQAFGHKILTQWKGCDAHGVVDAVNYAFGQSQYAPTGWVSAVTFDLGAPEVGANVSGSVAEATAYGPFLRSRASGTRELYFLSI